MCGIVLNRITVSGQDKMDLLFPANVCPSSSWWYRRNQGALDSVKAVSASILTLTDLTCYRSRGKAWIIRENRGSRRHTWLASGPGYGCSHFTCSGLKPFCPREKEALIPGPSSSLLSQVSNFLNLLSQQPWLDRRAGDRLLQFTGVSEPTHHGNAYKWLLSPSGLGQPCFFLLGSWER